MPQSRFAVRRTFRIVAVACVLALLLTGTLQAAHFHHSAALGQYDSVGLLSCEHLCLLCATAMQAWHPEAQPELHAPPLFTSEPLPAQAPRYTTGVVLVFRVRPPPCAVQS